ncbi:MAG TPA: hypothetical protein VE891_08905 [Allosphingosinicella sp.]|nr:hypothetical protein [Allosphingosinicella sp.]
MKLRSLILCTGAALLLPTPLAAQPSLADQKLQADIDKAKLDMEAARLKMQLDQQSALNTALAAVKGTTGGQASIDKPEATAEGMLLARRLYAGAASQLGDAVEHFPRDKAPIVVFGTAAPSTADWLGFTNLADRLALKLDAAIKDWDLVKSQTPAQPPAGPRSLVGAATVAATVLNVGTSVASLFRVDTNMAGAPLTPTDQQVHSLLSQALADEGFKVDGSGLGIAGEPLRVKNRLARLEPDYLRAHQRYHVQYLAALAKVKKVEDLPPAQVLAGKHLESAISDYETLQRSLYTSTAGMLPATVIERQAILVEDPDRPIVYIRNHKAALTTLTRKGFLTTLGSSVPIYLNGAAEVDYLLLHGGEVRPGSVVCSTPRARITAVSAATITCTRPLPVRAQAVASHRRGAGGGDSGRMASAADRSDIGSGGARR